MDIQISAGEFGRVADFQESIPEFRGSCDSRQDIIYRGTHLDGRIFSVHDEKDHIAALLFAYREKQRVWYNHITAVHPDFRGRGAASALIRRLETFAAEDGAERITVKSMNRFPRMLRLLIKEGYAIVGMEQTKILFSKKL
ncbi:MAG: GNAT family N-acetyltransferase [Fibrobacterota bacterium]